VKTPAPHGRFLFLRLPEDLQGGESEAKPTVVLIGKMVAFASLYPPPQRSRPYPGGTVSISFPANTGVECGAPSGEPPACSTVTA
jgi:hypothetical protein